MKHAAESLLSSQRAESDPKTLKHIFVVGFPRSGTTWVMWLLAKLPSVVALHQSGMFHALRDIEGWWRAHHSFSKKAGDVPEQPGVLNFNDTTGVLPVDDYFKLVKPLCDHVHDQVAAASPSSEAVVEQTPENMEFEESIRQIFPGAYFLHVIRDPRDCCVSMLRAAKAWENELPGRAIHVANRWNEYIRRADKLKASTDRYIEVRYEDLKANAPAELERIAKQMGFSADLEACTKAVEACNLEQMRKRADLPKGFFGKGKVQGWRDDLSSSDLRVLEYIARDNMQRFGYEAEHKHSHIKPMRLKFHETVARGFARLRGPWLRRTKRFRATAIHLREEILYTQRMRK